MNRLVVWRHGYPRSVVRVVVKEFRRAGAAAGWRMARRALWLMFVTPLARRRR